MVSLKRNGSRIVQSGRYKMNSLLKKAPIISRVTSLGKTGPHGPSALTSVCLTDPGLLSLLLSMLPGQRHFMIHWGLHKGKAGERRQSETRVSTFCFLLTALGRGLVEKGILSNDLNISLAVPLVRKKMPRVAAQTYF